MLRRARDVLAVLTALVAMPQAASAACSAVATSTGDAGTWTSGQVANGVTENLTRAAGLNCSGALLTLVSDNQIVATVHSLNGFQLRKQGTSAYASYVASASPDGSYPFSQDSSVNYGDLRLIGLLGIGNSTSVDIPISFLAFRGSGLQTGTYTDVITITWRWRVCNGVNLLSLVCLFYETGSATTTYTLTMNVNGLPPIITIATATVYDPIRGRTNPLSIPGSRQITTVSITNPDVVPLDRDSLFVDLPTPARQKVSLVPVEGQNFAVELVQGAQDGMSCTYGGPTDATDDVEFSADGTTWTLQPTDGAQVRSTRVRIRGTLQPSKSVSVTVGRTLL